MAGGVKVLLLDAMRQRLARGAGRVPVFYAEDWTGAMQRDGNGALEACLRPQTADSDAARSQVHD